VQLVSDDGKSVRLDDSQRIDPGVAYLVKVRVVDVDADETPGVSGLYVATDFSATPNVMQVTITKATSGALTTTTIVGSQLSINNVLAGFNYINKVNNSADTITVTANDNGNVGQGGPLTGKAVLKLSITPAPPLAIKDSTGVVVGAAFAGVAGVIAAAAAWAKLHPKIAQEEIAQQGGTLSGGDNPLYEGAGFSNNALYERPV